MKIAVSMRRIENGKTPELMDAIAQSWVNLINEIRLNAVLIPIPNNEKTAHNIIRRFDFNGIILSGGNDWGAVEIRDNIETFLLKTAVKQKLPLFGVCRGMQVLNILFGKGSEKSLSKVRSSFHAGKKHIVNLDKECSLINSLGFRHSEIEVNSFHNYGVVCGRAAHILKIFAISGRDDIVEGLYHPELPIVGVQWHPERYDSIQKIDRLLIKRLFSEGAFWKTR